MLLENVLEMEIHLAYVTTCIPLIVIILESIFLDQQHVIHTTLSMLINLVNLLILPGQSINYFLETGAAEINDIFIFIYFYLRHCIALPAGLNMEDLL